MPFPSNSGTRAEDLEAAWAEARRTATNIKQICTQIISGQLSGALSSTHLLNVLSQFVSMRQRLQAVAALPGIGAYAQAQINEPGTDIVAEFQTMTTALGTTIDWIVANFPKDAGGYLLASQFDAQGRTVDRTFSTAALTTFRTQITALVATID